MVMPTTTATGAFRDLSTRMSPMLMVFGMPSILMLIHASKVNVWPTIGQRGTMTSSFLQETGTIGFYLLLKTRRKRWFEVRDIFSAYLSSIRRIMAYRKIDTLRYAGVSFFDTPIHLKQQGDKYHKRDEEEGNQQHNHEYLMILCLPVSVHKASQQGNWFPLPSNLKIFLFFFAEKKKFSTQRF